MKELKAYIRESRLKDVVRALRAAGATSVTVVKTVPMGAEIEPEYVDTLRDVPVEHFAPMMKLELVCEDHSADRYIDIIREAARTGERGDGVVFAKEPAAKLAAAQSIEDVRLAFAALSEVLVPRFLDAELPGVVGFVCTMKNARWVQRGETVANPYYGKAMATCGVPIKRGG